MTNLIVFEYGGEQVTYDPQADMWNLNAMHQAAGGDPGKAPWRWSETEQAKTFIEALCCELNLAKNEVYQARRGRYDGGTWAHWQIAATYAQYLNPRFHIQWNRWAMERQQQLVTPAPAAPAADLAAEVAALGARMMRVEHQLGITAPRGLPAPHDHGWMGQEHAAILAIVVYNAPHGITTRRLMAACGVVRERPSSFFRRLCDLREAGYVYKAGHKMAPNHATRAGHNALAAYDDVR